MGTHPIFESDFDCLTECGKMGSYAMNYNWHKKFAKNAKVNYNELYLLGLAEKNKRKKELEQQKKNSDEQRKKELEAGFSTYQKDYHSKSRPVTRSERPKSTTGAISTKQIRTPPSTRPKSSRKSWADNLGQNGDDDDDELPAFVRRQRTEPLLHIDGGGDRGCQYSDDFDSVASSMDTTASILASPRTSYCVPKMIPETGKSRKMWKVDSSIPFKISTPPLQATPPSPSPPSSSIDDETHSLDELKELAITTRKTNRNWLEESWSLIDELEKNNKGRQSIIIPQKLEEVEEDEPMEIEIPRLPRGKIIQLYILSTWGDRNYVGLNGIEFWNAAGEHIKPTKIGSDGSLESTADPRSNFYNLIDGENATKDDLHCWLGEPVCADQTPKLIFNFSLNETFSMIRIWNFNRNRVHADRGVRNVVIECDQKPIFAGEIAKASGAIATGRENILFTDDDVILAAIARNDASYP